MTSTPCSECGLSTGNERSITIDGRLYHGRCWETMRSQSRLTNHARCPECSLPIRQGDSTSLRGGYAIHLACELLEDG